MLGPVSLPCAADPNTISTPKLIPLPNTSKLHLSKIVWLMSKLLITPYPHFVILQFINLLLLLSTDPLSESICNPILESKDVGIVSPDDHVPTIWIFSNTLFLQLSRCNPICPVVLSNVKSLIVIFLAWLLNVLLLSKAYAPGLLLSLIVCSIAADADDLITVLSGPAPFKVALGGMYTVPSIVYIPASRFKITLLFSLPFVAEFK